MRFGVVYSLTPHYLRRTILSPYQLMSYWVIEILNCNWKLKLKIENCS